MYRGDQQRYGADQRTLLFDEGEVLSKIKYRLECTGWTAMTCTPSPLPRVPWRTSGCLAGGRSR